ncbi:hypothetical protein GGR50DRAFT_637044 [Xylaria sp. CBS 124048]|nr:hypothetical protein GGR50DRAFT_637044 [Xylaria sp. CBS 124048]
MVQQTGSLNIVEARITPSAPTRHSFSHPVQPTNSWSEPWEPVEDWASSAQMLDETFTGLNNLLGDEDLGLGANTPTSGGQPDDGSHATTGAETIHCSLGTIMDVSVSSSPSDSASVASTRHQIDRNGDTTPLSPSNISPDLGFGLPTPHSLSDSAPHPTQKPQLVPASVSQTQMGEKELARLDSRCVLACTHIIATLESYLLLDLKALDLILEATRKATNELEKLVHLQAQSRRGRCILLFTAALSQITELLHIGTKQLPDAGAGPEDKLIPGLQLAFMPTLGFSAFSFAAEEQSSLRLSLIRRECRHVERILASVEALAGKGMVEQRTTCLKSIKQKLDEMCDMGNRPSSGVVPLSNNI